MPLLDDPALRSVLLVRARVGLGDLLCTVPALRALRRHRPDLHVALLTYGEMRPVVDRLAAWVDELVPLPGWPGIPERPVPRDALDPFLAEVRARRFDVAVQQYGANPAANALTDALGAARTAGFFVTGAYEADLSRFLPYPQHRHEVDRHLDLMALLGAPPAGRALEFPVSAADEAEAEDLLREVGLAGRPYAILHPGATSASRRWPFERWAEVGDGLAARGLAVAVTGVAGEEAAASAVRDRMRAPSADLCGRLGLAGFAALLRGAALLAGNDSGPAHLAAAVGTPSVTAFLSGDPVRWAHPPPLHRAARVQVECNPCPHLTCPIDHRCAVRLPVEAVLEHGGAALRSARG